LRPSSAFLTGQVWYRGLVRLIREDGAFAFDALVILPGWQPWRWERPWSAAMGPADEVTGEWSEQPNRSALDDDHGDDPIVG
jgi:hypothetical protein